MLRSRVVSSSLLPSSLRTKASPEVLSSFASYSTTPTPPTDAFWLPFTPNQYFKANPRKRLLVEADGVYYTNIDGKKLLDGTSGLWCVNAGHNRRSVADAVYAQLKKLDYAPNFQLANNTAFEFADELVKQMPFDKVFFTNSGSESVDTALKIALAYHNVRGEAGRTRLIGRNKGYHGVGFGGISVGGIAPNRKYFGPLLPGVDHLPFPYSREHSAFSKGQPEYGAHFADALEELVTLHDASTIAAVIVEPVIGSAGVYVPPKGYLERLREITKKHGILLIFDEVITGFGRLGASCAAEYFNIQPDMATTAKGLTSGFIPMGAVFTQQHVYDTFMTESSLKNNAIELFHGYTYSGHPAACAAGLETLKIYKEEGLFERAKELSGFWEESVHSLKGLDHVLDIRNIGLVVGIEFDPRKDKKPRSFEVFDKCLDEGLMVRFTGDTVALAPPLIVDKSHITQMVDILRKVISSLE
eukprot:CAMPEP_0174260716 /NCGR_PEP_ID=MMETSP0439-20130205/10352_1 /TAXON_ID=0 /ORGANISM="Stereomyxa ramosa, Strain Chinc5" /LENGTH=471 /DNA_ID=CAMNT_0015345023 /DNA_START=44 /DNA_END=1459 /DNA_ORIENTATION=-